MALSTQLGWKLAAAGAGAAAGGLTRVLVAGGWRKARHQDPPENPASPATSWPEAVAWAAVSGVALGVARLVAQRGAAGVWKLQTGALPHDVRESGTAA